ncbi:MAG: crosslink repair DNA glycosylase YcaQ family protein [Propionicimonas sp.]
MGIRQLQQVVATVAQLQIDSVNVAVRAHAMPIFSRMGPYGLDLLERAAGRSPRRLFEYWGHAASLIDVGLQPALRHRMAAQAGRPWRDVERIRADHPGLFDDVLALIERSGPVTARQVEHPDGRTAGSWWNWSDAKYVLEWLFATGEVTVSGRNTQFERLYELPQRTLPAAVWNQPTPNQAEAELILVRRAAAALGIASVRCLADYFRMSVAAAGAAIARLLATGELIETPVRGWDRPTYLWHGARVPRRLHVNALVSPFDSLVFERRRLLDLFGVSYRIELYTPAAQRRYGYYVYLFVMDDAIAARVDLKAARGRGLLLVQSAWLEPGCPRAETAARLNATLTSMAQWLGLGGVQVMGVGTLAAALLASAD